MHIRILFVVAVAALGFGCIATFVSAYFHSEDLTSPFAIGAYHTGYGFPLTWLMKRVIVYPGNPTTCRPIPHFFLLDAAFWSLTSLVPIELLIAFKYQKFSTIPRRLIATVLAVSGLSLYAAGLMLVVAREHVTKYVTLSGFQFSYKVFEYPLQPLGIALVLSSTVLVGLAAYSLVQIRAKSTIACRCDRTAGS